MGEEPAKAEPERYRAFISYSHGDAKFAHWLHRKLESWRLPDKSRLTPVFIDRAELAAGADLSAQVREALGQSAALVVVCSPNARASRWVGQEIALFRALHPDRPVLAALIEGEPGDAFPDPLLGTDDKPLEPLAADFRKGHDGNRLGLLKLAAGLTALPLDRLVQRDAAARQRRVMAITAGAVVLSLVLSGLLVFAVRQRNEAQRQRAEAEGMVEFMLTDLRDKLKGTGSPTIMASVNQRALDYYSHMDVTSLPDDSLDRRARVLHAMGEDNEKLGNFPAAQKMYQEAWRITDEVLKRHPDSADAIFAHAQSEFWVGEAAWQQGDLETTGVHWRGYLQQAEALAKAEPKTTRSFAELGYAKGNLCELTERQTNNITKSLPYCHAAVFNMEEALAASPDDTQIALSLANRLGWHADVLRKHKRYAEAVSMRDQEAEIAQKLLIMDPNNFEFRERALWPMIGKSRIYIETNQFRSARKILDKCIKSLDLLQSLQPSHAGIMQQRLTVLWYTMQSYRHGDQRKFRFYRDRTENAYYSLKTKIGDKEITRFSSIANDFKKG